MQESCRGDLANHFGFELYADVGNDMGVATTEAYGGQQLSSEIKGAERRANSTTETLRHREQEIAVTEEVRLPDWNCDNNSDQTRLVMPLLLVFVNFGSGGTETIPGGLRVRLLANG